MRCRSGRVLLSAWGLSLVAVVGLAGQRQAPDGPAQQRPDAAQVRQWVKDLDADSFVVRESATGKLIHAGAAAIGPLVSALPGGSLEVTTRGIHVLRELALSGDPQTETAAHEALAAIAASRGTSAARRAATTLAMLDQLRQRRAMAELEKLGAELEHPGFLLGGAFVAAVRSLTIGDKWAGEAQDLRRLKWLRNVTQITLQGANVTDDYIKHVCEMENVREVIIKRARITDQAMAHLKRLTNLAHLAVLYCPISDKSVDHLKGHTNATLLKIYGTEMTEQGAKELQQALAGATVDYRRGAFLGVGCQPHEKGCEIALLHPKSAAAVAGLQVGDVIVKYDGQNVVDFQNLTRLIAGNRAGDTVTIQVLRENELFTKKVKLGEWE